MKHFLSLIISVALFEVVSAKEIKYKYSDISQDLKNDAKAVVRIDKTEFEITSLKQGKMSCQYAVTILNKGGDELGKFMKIYDKFNKISNIKAHVYNKSGEEIERVKPSEIIDRSAVSGVSIYDDNRMKRIDPGVFEYPYTVEYTWDESFNGFLAYPNWKAFPGSNISVQYSEYSIIYPSDFKFKIQEKNLTKPVEVTTIDSKTKKRWVVENVVAKDSEPYSNGIAKFMPYVQISPIDFEYDGYPGNMESWNSFGKWIVDLNNKKNIVPEETKKKMIEITKNAKSEFEKIKIVYEYVQNKTRYVSIQVGIGGFQPFDAETVDRLSYGDCKALSNYTKALLEVVGINARYTLVRAGVSSENVEKDFPSQQFNHAFVCVPINNNRDTVWLECTSQKIPCGYLGTFTDDRDVLLIEENGGKLVHSKVYTANDNVKSCNASIQIDANGLSAAKGTIKHSGIYYTDMFVLLHYDDKDREKMVYNLIQIPSFKIKSFSIDEFKDVNPIINLNLDLDLTNYCSKMGDRLVLPLNLLNKSARAPKKLDERLSDIYVKRATIDADTLRYSLPENYKTESLPADVLVQSKYGEYKASVTANDGKTITYTRYFKFNSGSYPASEYSDFIKFFEEINKADNMKCVLKKEV